MQGLGLSLRNEKEINPPEDLSSSDLKEKNYCAHKKEGPITILTIMEKFKNALKSVNKFGLALVMLTAITLVAFKAPEKKVNNLLTEYGRDVDNNWVEVTASPGEETGEYTCESSNKVCRAYFESQPGNDAMPLPVNIIQADGTYTVH